MALLAEPNVVTDLLPQTRISADQLSAAQRLVASWLKQDAALDELPDSLTDDDDLFGAAFELVTLLVTNPELLASKTVGPTSRSWPLAQRRDAIRADVRASAKKAASAPRGSFPPPQAWPDPIVSGVYWDPATRTWCVAS
jgi:hypothetical protein